MASRRFLLQLGAVAAASSLLAAMCPVDAALPPLSRDAPATTGCTDVPRTVDDDDIAAAISRGAGRLGPPRHIRSLSDIPADAKIALLVAGLVNMAALLASLVAGLYSAARTDREKARVRPLGQDAVEAAGH